MAEKKKADLAALSPEARAIIDTKKVSGRRRLREWFKLLKEVAAFDETVDELRARLNKQAIIFLVLTFVFFIISFPVFILGFPLLILIVTPILFVVFLVLTIVSFKKKGGLGKIDLANEFRETLIPFLQIISEDLHPKARIALELDMAGLADAKKVREEEIPPGRFRKVTETEYRDPWCKLEAPLVARATVCPWPSTAPTYPTTGTGGIPGARANTRPNGKSGWWSRPACRLRRTT